jgi:6-phosphogluconolactonase (cycloisomerase 2 family)
MPDPINKGITCGLACLIAIVLVGCGSTNSVKTTPPPPATVRNFLYAANDYTIAAWEINPADGSLSALASSPYPGLDEPMGVAIDPLSKFIAVVNLNYGRLNVFAVNASDGSLSEVAGSPFILAATGGYELSPVFDSHGNFLYICDSVYANSISVYAVNTTTGEVTFSNTFNVVPPISSLAIHPSGTYLYALGSGVNAFQVSAGTLVEMSGSPFATSLSLMNAHAVVSLNGKFLLVADFDAEQLHVLTLNADGSVGAEASGSPLALSAHPLAIATNSTSTTAVLTTDAKQVLAVPFDANSGALGSAGSPASTGDRPLAVVVDVHDAFVYVANQTDKTVSGFALGSGASLVPVAGSPSASGDQPFSVVTTRLK